MKKRILIILLIISLVFLVTACPRTPGPSEYTCEEFENENRIIYNGKTYLDTCYSKLLNPGEPGYDHGMTNHSCYLNEEGIWVHKQEPVLCEQGCIDGGSAGDHCLECGDGICEGQEYQQLCIDCPVCGDNSCTAPIETKSNCFSDCTTNAIHEVPVLAIVYIPRNETDPSLFDPSFDGGGVSKGMTVQKLDDYTKELGHLIVESLTRGSAYHFFTEPPATPSLRYSINHREILYKHMIFKPNSLKPDYVAMFTQDIDVCDYVDNHGVKEVWLFRYRPSDEGVWESNMAMGTVSQEYWNKGDYGDISNSYETNDLPVCQNTYTAYGYYYARGLGEALENHGHQIEAVMDYQEEYLWQDLFIGNPPGPKPSQRCGWTHCPPNVMHIEPSCPDYSWFENISQLSDCEDWTPDGSGEKKLINCSTWKDVFHVDLLYRDDGCGKNYEFKIWWMQNLPGANNNLYFNGKKLKNWWDFIGDFDNAITNRGLTCSDENLCTSCVGDTSEECYSGPIETLGKGSCKKGTISCVNGSLSSCIGEVTPIMEICDDGLDNDCDSLVDLEDETCLCNPPFSGMIAYWPFDDPTALGKETYGKDLINAGAQSTNGILNKGTKTDFDSFLYTFDESLKTDNFSVSIWANGTTTSHSFLLHNAWGYSLSISWSNHQAKAFVSIASSSTDEAYFSNNPYGSSKWYNFVGTYDGDLLKFYINGSLVSEREIPEPPTYASDRSFTLGGSSFPSGTIKLREPFNGDLDEIAIWDRALTASEIQTLYNNVLAGKNYCES